MRLTIAAVGRVRDAPEQALCDLYLERARGLGSGLGFTRVDLAIVETSRAATAEARMAEEAARLAAALPDPVHGIVLDEAGRSLGSEAFAQQIGSWRDQGIKDIAFLIGGPDGLAPALQQAARLKLAFGAQTWPHLLVRAMLAEQVYRAFAILARHPYHRPKLSPRR